MFLTSLPSFFAQPTAGALAPTVSPALVVSPEGCFISFDGLSVVYPSIISSGGTVV